MSHAYGLHSVGRTCIVLGMENIAERTAEINRVQRRQQERHEPGRTITKADKADRDFLRNAKRARARARARNARRR